MIQTIVPKSEAHWHELRAQDITSTEVSSLFKLSPYSTPFELWHRKKGNLAIEHEENERQKWGLKLQDTIAHTVAEERNWHIRRKDEYMRDSDLRAGASFDFEIPNSAIIEVKNVDAFGFKDGWIIDGNNVEAPPHIELQVQQQMKISGLNQAYIVALVGGNKLVLIKREPDLKVQNAISTKIEEFWESISKNKEPNPDFSRDTEVISRICGVTEPGKLFDVRGNDEINGLIQEYKRLSEEEKRISIERDAIKARLILQMGDCEKAIGDGFSISASMVAAKRVETYERKAYRNFRINFKKEIK